MTVVSILGVVKGEPAAPENDTRTYFRLDENLEPVACNRTEREAFEKARGHIVATTHFGTFASVTTAFDGRDDFDPDDPHPFTTLTVIPGDCFSEGEGHRNWHEAEAAHRERVDELKARLERERVADESQLEML